jgi:polysaccharide biosynthesis transport protein
VNNPKPDRAAGITAAMTAPAAGEDELDLIGLVRTVWRGKWFIALCIVIAVGIGGWQTFRVATPLFTATATMVLRVNPLESLNVESVLMGLTGDEVSMNTEMEVIQSRELIGRLVQTLDLVNDPEFNPSLIEDTGFSVGRLIDGLLARVIEMEPPEPPTDAQIFESVVTRVQGAVSAEIELDAYIFYISATAGDSDKAALMVNTLAEIYREDQVALKIEATQSATVWLSEQVGLLEIELSQSLAEISALRSQSALVSPEGLQALSEQAIELRELLREAELASTEAGTYLAGLRAAQDQDIAAQVAAAGDGQLTALAATLAGAEPPPPGDALDRFNRRYAQVVLRAEAEADRTAEVVAELNARTLDLSEQFERQSAVLADLQEMERETQATQVLYETFLTQLKETSVQEGVFQADSRVLSPALPGLQIAPRPALTLAVSFMLGAVLGTAIVLIREFMQNTYRSGEELEKGTGRVVLGQIPKIPRRGRRPTVNYLVEKPTSAAAEAVRNLRTSVLMSNMDAPPQVIMSTSSLPGEGKTTLAISLANNLAGLGKKVLLVEGDIRKRTFETYFSNGTATRGLISVLFDKTPLADVVVHDETLRIDVLIGEKSSVNPADVFSSDAFKAFMATLRSSYDYVVVDTPPVLLVPDARILARHMDAVIYTVAWDKTSKSQVQEGLRQFASVDINVTGVVLSQIDPKGMRRYGYGGRYGAYGSKGRGYYEN